MHSYPCAQQHSHPLPPIGSAPSQHHQQPLFEVDSAVDLEYHSHCSTPDDLPPHSLLTCSYAREEGQEEGAVPNPVCRHPQSDMNRGVKGTLPSWSRSTSEAKLEGWSPAVALEKRNYMAGNLGSIHPTETQLITKDSGDSVPIWGDNTAGEGRRVQLCLRLPGGERLLAEFSTSQRIADLVSYAQQHCGEDLSKYELATNEVPRRVVPNWQVTLEQAGITVRTLLYFSLH